MFSLKTKHTYFTLFLLLFMTSCSKKDQACESIICSIDRADLASEPEIPSSVVGFIIEFTFTEVRDSNVPENHIVRLHLKEDDVVEGEDLIYENILGYHYFTGEGEPYLEGFPRIRLFDSDSYIETFYLYPFGTSDYGMFEYCGGILENTDYYKYCELKGKYKVIQ